MNNPLLILASASPRRYELLSRCGVDFTVRSADAAELTAADDLAALPMINARIKADAVAAENPAAWVLAADTMIIFDSRAVGKPADLEEAGKFLAAFSGRSHEVVTGMALINREKNIAEIWSESSTVSFKVLSPEVIREYLEQVEVLDKAGAYAIQEHGELIVESFTGEVENIVGLPLKKLQSLLTKYAIGGKL